MPKQKQINLKQQVMSKVQTGQIKMRPHWYFVAGSVFALISLVALIILLPFLLSLVVFALRTHGPMGALRFQELLSSFPLWTIPVSAVGFSLSVFLLRRYDFAYRYNFKLIVLGFILAMLLAGYLFDTLKLNSFWLQRNQRFYNKRGLRQFQKTEYLNKVEMAPLYK